MVFGYKRTDLQAMAEGKIADASLLLQNSRFSNAYYLAGYAVEIGLKACISRLVAAETIPDKTILKGFLDHQFVRLVGLAGLNGELRKRQVEDPDFGSNWAIVSEWTPDHRYEPVDSVSAQTLVLAIVAADSGVLQWIRQHW